MPKDRTQAELNSAIDEISRVGLLILDSRNRTSGYGNPEDRIAALEEQMDIIASILKRL